MYLFITIVIAINLVLLLFMLCEDSFVLLDPWERLMNWFIYSVAIDLLALIVFVIGHFVIKYW